MDNENKIYDLLEKLYIDMQGMKSEMKDMKSIMATKDDIANMATKDDLVNFATKDDLVNLATRDDLANLATKADLDSVRKELKHEIQYVYKQVRDVNDSLNKTELLTVQNTYDIAKLKIKNN